MGSSVWALRRGESDEREDAATATAKATTAPAKHG